MAYAIPAFSAGMFAILGERLAKAERPRTFYYCCEEMGCHDVFICELEEGYEVESTCEKGHTATRSWGDAHADVEELKPFRRVFMPQPRKRPAKGFERVSVATEEKPL